MKKSLNFVAPRFFERLRHSNSCLCVIRFIIFLDFLDQRCYWFLNISVDVLKLLQWMKLFQIFVICAVKQHCSYHIICRRSSVVLLFGYRNNVPKTVSCLNDDLWRVWDCKTHLCWTRKTKVLLVSNRTKIDHCVLPELVLGGNVIGFSNTVTSLGMKLN